MKGGTLARLERAVFLSGHGANQVRNRLELALSLPPGDFSGNESILYLTKQREVAWKYADYRKRVTQPSVEIAILHALIPQDLIAETGLVEIFGDVWKEYVMFCHLSQPVPPHLQYITQSSIILGCLLWKSPEATQELVGNEMDFTRLDPL